MFQGFRIEKRGIWFCFLSLRSQQKVEIRILILEGIDEEVWRLEELEELVRFYNQLK